MTDNLISAQRSAARSGLTRRSAMAAAGVAGVAGLTVALDGSPVAASAAHRSGPGNFVTAHKGQLWLHGKPFRFGGTNCYYLHQQSHYMIDNVLDDAAAMSLSVLRAEAFADGSGHGFKALQSEPYVYEEANFDSLDYSVYKAGQLGIKLVLVLVNNWPDYGGMAQYVQWFLNLPDDTYSTGANHDRFYTTPAIKDCYKAHLRHLTRRVNPYTGLRYNEDPTIMTFELANEPRCRSDKSGATLIAWVREMSGYLKRLAPRQLVAVGDEGFYGDPNNSDYPYSDYEGARWRDTLVLPAVDYATIHLYPQGLGEYPQNKPGADPVEFGAKWIKEHLADAKAAGKPMVLEEFGLAIDASRGIPDTAARDAGYRAWTDTVRDSGGAGDQFWLLTSRVDDGSFYPNYDGYRIIWFNDPSNDTNSTAHLLSEHAKAMAGGRS